MRIGRSLIVVGLAVGSLVAAGLSQGKSASPTRPTARHAASFNTTPAQDAKVLKDTLAWIARKNVKPTKKYRIAWVKEDAGLESYTQNETKGGLDAAKKYGASVKKSHVPPVSMRFGL